MKLVLFSISIFKQYHIPTQGNNRIRNGDRNAWLQRCKREATVNPEGRVWTQLLTAISRVASLKSQTIPRLELSGALFLTSLLSTIQQAPSHNVYRAVYWTDSTIVLHWINTSPHILKTFIANRISEMQTKTGFARLAPCSYQSRGSNLARNLHADPLAARS
jgi:hypothetical protein